MNYEQFLDKKRQLGDTHGFRPLWIPDRLFDFQRRMLDWSIRKGRGAIFADCGLGKTFLQLAWAENVVRKTNKPVLIIAPLAVSLQTVGEGAKFGIECRRSNTGKATKGITITNYEQLKKFNPNDFAGAVCDESGILKSFDGVTRSEITEFMRKLPYRMLYTATPAPNDYFELGTSSEALGYLGYMDMLLRFFKNNQNNSIAPFRLKLHPTKMNGVSFRENNDTAKWILKGHAEEQFWRWVCSWALACRRPSDLGFKNGKFILPKLLQQEHIIGVTRAPKLGDFFSMPARSLRDQRSENRETIDARCEQVASLINARKGPSIAWCHLNTEGDLLTNMIEHAVQVSGKDDDDAKEEKLLGFIKGDFDKLVIKPKIGAWGLNMQRCAHMTIFPSHSYEQIYQMIRRCWRFGQANNVVVDIVATEGERLIMRNLQRKTVAADKMFEKITELMNNALSVTSDTKFPTKEELPSWL